MTRHLELALRHAYHDPNPHDGPRIRRLKQFARQVPLETIWQELDAWCSAQVSAAVDDLLERDRS
jgi:hypothetical protein